MTEILGIGEAAVGRILKNVGFSTLKHVKTMHDAETKRAKGWRLAGEIPQLYAGGMRTKSILWSDETWADRDTCGRPNPKNDRMYSPKGTKKDDALDDLRAPLRLRTPGNMARISATSAQRAVLLKPRFAGPEKNVPAE